MDIYMIELHYFYEQCVRRMVTANVPSPAK